ncbi:MAG: hypothetical protein R2751_11905 [Bacteroidales bacterium]
MWDFVFDDGGNRIAASISPLNLIDHRYMFRRISLIDLSDGTMRQVSANEGKLGNYAFSPDGSRLAYAAALDRADHQVSQAFVADLTAGPDPDVSATPAGSVRNLTPEGFKGHIEWVSWKDDQTLLFTAGEGVYNTLNSLPPGGAPRVLAHGKDWGLTFEAPVHTADLGRWVFVASTPSDASNLYAWNGTGAPRLLTDLNPVLRDRILGRQEVVRFAARDGQAIEGLLIHPPMERTPEVRSFPDPLCARGPESHHSHGWLELLLHPRPGHGRQGLPGALRELPGQHGVRGRLCHERV